MSVQLIQQYRAQVDKITCNDSSCNETGIHSAVDWVLDRYKERKPRDPTNGEKFNIYRFADYKEHVINLLRRVCTVSVETMRIIHQMPEGQPGDS